MKIASNGIHIYVEEKGSGDLPIVFLHYWGGSSRTWRHVTAELSQSHRIIATDHRGWGQSDAPEGGYGLSDLAADAEGVIKALNLQRYILVGHSMGGKVAQLMASRRPKGLVGLVLVAPAPPSPLSLPAEARETMTNAYKTAETVEMTIDHVLAAKALSSEDRAQIVEDSLRGAPQAKAAWPQSTSLEDITQEVTLIDAPTIVISGELDRVDPPEVLRRELLALIPQAQLHVLPQVGHLSPLEAPNDIADLIGAFAQSLANQSEK